MGKSYYDRVSGGYYRPKYSHNLHKDAKVERKVDNAKETFLQVKGLIADAIGIATNTKPITDMGKKAMQLKHNMKEATDSKNPLNGGNHKNFEQISSNLIDGIYDFGSDVSNFTKYTNSIKNTTMLNSNKTGSFISDITKIIK